MSGASPILFTVEYQQKYLITARGLLVVDDRIHN